MATKLSKPVWIIITLIVTSFTAFVVVRNLWHIWEIKYKLNELSEQAEEYKSQIEADSTLIERLQYNDYLEEYARERFNMQRKNEKIFIIE